MTDNTIGELNTITQTTTTDDCPTHEKLESEWLNLCMLGVASTNAALSSWLLITCASISLHSPNLGLTPASRENTRMTLIKNITQSERHCKDLLRISPDGFLSLLQNIKSHSKVKNYIRGSLEEQLITFLLIVGHNFKNRVVGFLLCRSGETVSRYFHNILMSVITLEDIFVKPSIDEDVQPIIMSSHRFFPFFKDCLGVIDGTHIRVKVSQLEAPRYRGIKDWPTQNVLATCTFDLKFTYVLAGWEGSASDSRILQSALTRDNPLLIPEGKFNLGDAGFGLTSQILTPYGRTRYHLKEYSQRPPETPEELFNHRHSSLRNAIERAFGVMKKRFPIIASGTECHFSCQKMTYIILACCILHNFLITIDSEDDYIANQSSATASSASTYCQVDAPTAIVHEQGVNYNRGVALRDIIAREMWVDYCAHCV